MSDDVDPNEVEPLGALLIRDFPHMTAAEYGIKLAEYRDAAERARQWRLAHPCPCAAEREPPLDPHELAALSEQLVDICEPRDETLAYHALVCCLAVYAKQICRDNAQILDRTSKLLAQELEEIE
jgi:hypothetical protein